MEDAKVYCASSNSVDYSKGTKSVISLCLKPKLKCETFYLNFEPRWEATFKLGLELREEKKII